MVAPVSSPAAALARPGQGHFHVGGPRDLAALHRDTWRVMASQPLILVAFPVLLWAPFDFAFQLAGATGAGLSVRADVLLAAFFTSLACTVVGIVGNRGSDVSVPEILRQAHRNWHKVFFVQLAVSLVTCLGLLFFVVPGLIAFAALSLAGPAAALEGLGVGASMRRSMELTRGVRWRIGGIMGTVSLVYGAIFALPSIASMAALGLPFESSLPPLAVAAVVALTSAPASIAGVLWAVLTALLFHDRAGNASRLAAPVGVVEPRSQDALSTPAPSDGRRALGLTIVAAFLAFIVEAAVVGSFVLSAMETAGADEVYASEVELEAFELIDALPSEDDHAGCDGADEDHAERGE